MYDNIKYNFIYSKLANVTRTHKTIDIIIERPVFDYVDITKLYKIYETALKQIINRWSFKEPFLRLNHETIETQNIFYFQLSYSKNFDNLNEMMKELDQLHQWFNGLLNNHYLTQDQMAETIDRIEKRWKFTPTSKIIEKIGICSFYLNFEESDKGYLHDIGEYIYHQAKHYLNYGIKITKINDVSNQYKVTCYNEETNMHRLINVLKHDPNVLFLKVKYGLKPWENVI